MEFAFYVSREELLSAVDANSSRIYFGCEFCEKLIPSPEEVERALDFCRERNLGFSLVTPYCTDKGISKLKEIFTILSKEEKVFRREVVANDWGTISVLGRDYPSLSPVFGRLMTKIKRGPRLMPIIDVIPGDVKEYYRSTNLDLDWYVKSLKSLGIGRIELDNVFQGYNHESISRDFKVSLYMPFSFVSTTRFCLAAGCEDAEGAERVGIRECRRECQNYTFILRSKGMPVPLIRKGNTIFSKNDTPPPLLASGIVDRIILQPEIPN